jgi:excisionase family DNA binding protein
MDDRWDGIEALWDGRDVARYLKVSRSWVYQKAEAGLLPYLKVGGLVRFVPERIRAFALGPTCGTSAMPSEDGLARSGGATPPRTHRRT